MIFVTVGTHEQAFNRLLQNVDKLVEKGIIHEKTIVQVGYSTYEPKYCEWQHFYPYNQMVDFISKARIVVTHGGPSSFIMPLQVGKIPIVVPRMKIYKEHVNNHQLDFSTAFSNKWGSIIVVKEMDKLGETINNYDLIVSNMNKGIKSNNSEFNDKLSKIIEKLFAEGKINAKK